MSASRPAQDQVPPTTPPPQTAEQARYRRRGHRSAPPPPRPPNSVPGGADLVSIFGWTSALADTSSHRNAVPGQEASGGCGKARPQAWGCRSGLKGTGMPGPGEGQELVSRLWKSSECPWGRGRAGPGWRKGTSLSPLQQICLWPQR